MRDWEADIAWYLLAAFVVTALMLVVSRVGHAAIF